MQLKEILDRIEAESISSFRDLKVRDLSYDSRLVRPGQAFFCIKGLVTDGHRFVGEAIRRGAEVLFVEREPEEEIPPDVVMVKVRDTRLALAMGSAKFYGDPSEGLKLVGVTGTNGKTTTAFLTENIFKKSGSFTGLIGTVENHIGDVVETVTRTTPESLDLQRLLRRMVDVGVEIVAMEVSSHALELHRVSGCKFDVVVFTNLTQDHLDFHISLEEYFGAKKRLFVGEDFGSERLALVNVDDEFGRMLLSDTTLRARSFGMGIEADIRASDVDVSSSGNRFKLSWDSQEAAVSTVLQGRFNVYNCLAAAGAAAELGADRDNIVAGLQSLTGVPGRFENVDCGQPFTALVDYAHTPDGIRNVLEACREVTGGRIIIVVGCGGDRDRSKRPLMGSMAVGMSDLCVITSDNPRGEDPQAIIDMIVEGVRDQYPPERYTVIVDRREAIKKAVMEARPDDLVVVAGKGHESGQIFSDGVIPFDDRQVVRECIGEVTGAQC